MARSSEKAMLMLNRWHEMKLAVVGGIRRRRPRVTEEVDTVKDAEFWRNNIVRELSVKISEIQNAGLGEARLRELNDEINRLLKEKARWEQQISRLGGQDANAPSSISMFDGGCITRRDGYKYFGAAKELKEAKELDLGHYQPPRKLTRAELAQRVKPSYYGWRDEELHPEILEAERALEEKLVAAASS